MIHLNNRKKRKSAAVINKEFMKMIVSKGKKGRKKDVEERIKKS